MTLQQKVWNDVSKNLAFEATKEKDHNTVHTLRLQQVTKYVYLKKKKRQLSRIIDKIKIAVFCSFRKKIVILIHSETCSEKPQFSKLFLTALF